VAAYEKRFNKPATQIGEFSYIGGMVIDAALQAVKGNIEDTEGFTKALEKVQLEAPSSSIKFDQYHNVIGDVFFAEVKKADGKLVNAVFERTPQVSQFWKWSPEEFLKMPTYNDLKGKWVK
ncbi:MAG: hypothetical protein Q8P59_12220, partial [Dehalococcoidia bacterium]|nr:hypothetical protein [Dehalococcoidia bacterium]